MCNEERLPEAEQIRHDRFVRFKEKMANLSDEKLDEILDTDIDLVSSYFCREELSRRRVEELKEENTELKAALLQIVDEVSSETFYKEIESLVEGVAAIVERVLPVTLSDPSKTVVSAADQKRLIEEFNYEGRGKGGE